MALMVIAHYADDDTGLAKLTYDTLTIATSLSRARLSHGLQILHEKQIVHSGHGRSEYQLAGYRHNGGWGKLPARRLYTGESITAFRDFYLRKAAELTAMKLYLLLVARRNRMTNMTHISYDTMIEYGIEQIRIKSGLSLYGWTRIDSHRTRAEHPKQLRHLQCL
jgi:hypothetical protein